MATRQKTCISALTILTLNWREVKMAVITVGMPAWDTNNNWYSLRTTLEARGPASGSGVLDYVELWVYNYNGGVTGLKVGTFFGSGTSWTSRDFHSFGNVGVNFQSFSGLDIDVEVGDLIGWVGTGNYFEADYGLGGNNLNSGGWADYFDGIQHSYTLDGAQRIPLYATGAEVSVGWANIAKVKGIAAADMAKINGVAVADVAKLNGIAV